MGWGGGGGFEPCSPHKRDQAMPPSYKTLGKYMTVNLTRPYEMYTKEFRKKSK